MLLEQMPLARQIEMVFRELKDELTHLNSGTIFLQIRDNIVGKFGVRHDPVEYREGKLIRTENSLTEVQIAKLRQLGIQALKLKNHWTHGEIEYEFALRKDQLIASVQFISNYNITRKVIIYQCF